jgi:nucleoside phosphorylase/CheY-like chemotaxis protein
MKIFVLEDSDSKFDAVSSLINAKNMLEPPQIERAKDFFYAQKALERDRYDLLILDLVVPLRPDSSPEDITTDISAIRLDEHCKNRSTPAIALTQFEEKAEEGFRGLNNLGVTVVTYNPDNGEWIGAIDRFIELNQPPLKFDFVIICALRKERDAYNSLGYQIGDEVIIDDLSCKVLTLGVLRGLIVVPTRMGLVSSAITSTKCIERFKPRVIAMSGICAGFESVANIYDVIVPERCYQHDNGKWSDQGFIMEPYQAALDESVRLKIDRILNRVGFADMIIKGITPNIKEFPPGSDCLTCSARLAVSSSGSSVIANNSQSEEMKTYHRKGAAFEMESYALYDAAVSSCHKPMFFSAKGVVDNGSVTKGDAYHRIACLVSARVCTTLISELLS